MSAIKFGFVAWVICNCWVSSLHAQLIVPGPVAPVSGICADWKALYPHTQITNNGDGIATSAAAFPNRNYAGYNDGYADAPYTVVIYNVTNFPGVPDPAGGTCTVGYVNYLKGDPGVTVYNLPDPCYKNAACRNLLKNRPAQILVNLDPTPSPSATSTAIVANTPSPVPSATSTAVVMVTPTPAASPTSTAIVISYPTSSPASSYPGTAG